MTRTTVLLWILGFSFTTAQVWGNPQYVNEDPQDEDNANNAGPSIATNGDMWITVWGTEEPIVDNKNKGTDMDIVFSISNSVTTTSWSVEDVVSNLALTDTADDSNPDIAYAGSNVWVVVWQTTEVNSPDNDDDIFYCFTTNNGVSWNNTNLLNNYFLDDGKNDVLPQIACYETYCVTVWYYQIVHNTVNLSSEVLVSTSNDRGFTWSYPQSIKTSAGIPDTYPAIAVNNNGNFVVAWLYGSALSNQIVVSTSVNFGVSWSTSISISSEANTNPPTIATLGNSEFLIGWSSSNSVPPLYSLSSNNGNSWSSPQTLGKDISTDVGGTVLNDVTVAGDPKGIWVAAWSVQNKPGYPKGPVILFSYSGDNALNWEQNDVIADFMNSNNSTLGESTPRLATTGNGNWVLVWETYQMDKPDIASVYSSYFTSTSPPITSPTTPGSSTPTTPGSSTPTTPGSSTPTTPGSSTPTTPGSSTPTTPGSSTPTTGHSPSGSVRERVWGIIVMVLAFVWIL